MRFLTSPDAVRFYSAMAGELSRHPDLAHRFYELGPGQTHRNLTAMIDAATTEGEIAVPSAAEAAEHLIGSGKGWRISSCHLVSVWTT